MRKMHLPLVAVLLLSAVNGGAVEDRTSVFGTVVSIRSQPDDPRAIRLPLVKFRLEDGREIEQAMPTIIPPTSLRVGSKAPLWLAKDGSLSIQDPMKIVDGPEPEILRIKDFAIQLTDFKTVETLPGYPFQQKMKADRSCAVGVSDYKGVSQLGLSMKPGTPESKSVNPLRYRIEGSDLVIVSFGFAGSPEEAAKIKHSVAKSADGSQTLEMSWASGLFGDTASLVLRISAKGLVLSVKAEQKTRDAHMLGAIANLIFGRNVTKVECSFE